MDLFIAGLIAGVGMGLFAVCAVELWRSRPVDMAMADLERNEHVLTIVAWCQSKIDAAERERDLRWVRRIVK